MSYATVSNTWGQEQWSQTLLEALIRESALLNSPVTTIRTDAKVVHVPRLSVHPSAAWVAELDDMSSDASNAGTEDVLVLTPRKIGNVLLLSNEAIEDASIDVLNSLGTGMARGLSHAVDSTAFGTSAETSTTPAGLLHGLTPDFTPTETNVVIDDLLDGIGLIEGNGGVANAIFLSSADLTAIRKQKASTGGQYLALPGGSVTGDITQPGVEMIGGARLFVSPGISAGTAVVADARFIQVAVRRDISVDFSSDAAFSQDAVVARVTARLDWIVGDRNAIAYILAS